MSRRDLLAALLVAALGAALLYAALACVERAAAQATEAQALRYDLYWAQQREAVLQRQYRIVRLERDSLRASCRADTVRRIDTVMAARRPRQVASW